MIFFLRLKSPKNIFKTLNQGIIMFKPMNLNPKSLKIKSSKIFAKIPLKKLVKKPLEIYKQFLLRGVNDSMTLRILTQCFFAMRISPRMKTIYENIYEKGAHM